MSARKPETTAETVKQYGERPVGGWGIRGWRSFCPACGFLSELQVNVRNAKRLSHEHRCAA